MKYIQVQPGTVFEIKLNRPDLRNAFNPEMIQEITQAFSQAHQDSSARLVVLRGEGKSFCAGADLEWMKSMVKFSRDENLKDSDKLFAMFEAARNCQKPVIGIIQGHAMGGGLGLVAICDFALAETSTQFCFSEVKLGLVPAVISSFCLEKMSYAHASQLMLSGEVFSAEKASEAQLVSFVGDANAVEQELQRLQKLLLANGPEAVRETKKLIRFIRESKDRGPIRSQATQVIAERRVSAEGQEGIQRFLESRKPNWLGRP